MGYYKLPCMLQEIVSVRNATESLDRQDRRRSSKQSFDVTHFYPGYGCNMHEYCKSENHASVHVWNGLGLGLECGLHVVSTLPELEAHIYVHLLQYRLLATVTVFC
jgi:hypothetical protein